MILKEKTIYKHFSSLYFIKEIRGNGIFAYNILEKNPFIINKKENFIMNYMEYISVGDVWKNKNSYLEAKISDILLVDSEIKIKYYINSLSETRILTLDIFISMYNKIEVKEEKMNCTKRDYLVSNCTTGYGTKISASSPKEAVESVYHTLHGVYFSTPSLICVFDVASQKFYFFKTSLVLEEC